jgi:UDP-N-acetylmuramoyl-tripeptide--D-alanyl-D-alanine ligase
VAIATLPIVLSVVLAELAIGGSFVMWLVDRGGRAPTGFLKLVAFVDAGAMAAALALVPTFPGGDLAERAGVDHDAAVRALAAVQLPEGRGDVRAIGGLFVIDDSYNANPASLRRAVQTAAWVARRQRRPLVVVVGTMLELGTESARLHAEAAREIVQRKPALVAAVGAFARAFEFLREDLGGRLITAADANALGPKLKSALRGNELVLLKASRGVALEQVLRYIA